MPAVLLPLVLATTLTVAAGGKLVLPEPSAPAPVVVEEVGPSPVYYRLPRDTVLFGFRSGVGASRRLAGEGRAGATAFALEIHAAAALAHRRASPYALLAEAGYSFSSYGAHFAELGAGPLLRGLGSDGPFSATEVSLVTPISVALLPHLVAGSLQGESAVGVRGTALVSFGLYGLALSYQRAWVGDRAVDELKLVLTSMSFGRGQR